MGYRAKAIAAQMLKGLLKKNTKGYMITHMDL